MATDEGPRYLGPGRTVTCPRCGARPYAYCTTGTGRPATVHLSRTREADRLNIAPQMARDLSLDGDTASPIAH